MFFQMHLAHELKMTRRELLTRMDSYELAVWSAYFRELNTPKEKKPKKEALIGQLKNAFMFAKKSNKNKDM